MVIYYGNPSRLIHYEKLEIFNLYSGAENLSISSLFFHFQLSLPLNLEINMNIKEEPNNKDSFIGQANEYWSGIQGRPCNGCFMNANLFST